MDLCAARVQRKGGPSRALAEEMGMQELFEEGRGNTLIHLADHAIQVQESWIVFTLHEIDIQVAIEYNAGGTFFIERNRPQAEEVAKFCKRIRNIHWEGSAVQR